MAYDWLSYANQNAVRNLPLAPNLVDALSFLPELGVRAEVFSGGQDPNGQTVGGPRHHHGGAGDFRFYDAASGRMLNWADEADRPIFEEIVRRGKERGITGFGAGPGYMAEGTMHIGYGTPAVWGAGGKGANAADWLVAAYNGAEAPPYERNIDMGGRQTMAYPNSRRGGLGGLGGMPEEPQQEGVSGFLNSSNGGDLLQAIGMSLMSSPSNNPLGNVASLLPDMQARSLKREEQQGDRRSIAAALQYAGLSPEEAWAYSGNPSAANLVVQAKEQQDKLDRASVAQQADRDFLSGLGGAGMAGDIPVGEGIPDPLYSPAPITGGVETGIARSRPAGQADRMSYGPQMPSTATMPGTEMAAPAAAPDPSEGVQPATFNTGNRTVDGLLARRARVAAQLAAAPSDDAFERGKVMLGQIDAQLEQYAPTGGMREYAFDMAQRQEAGLPMIRREEWDLEQRKAGATNVTVGAERAQDKKIGEGYGDIFLDVQKAGTAAGAANSSLNVMEQAMSSPDFYSGFGAENLMTIRRAATAFGLDPDGVSDMETFSAMSKRAVLDALGGSLGAGFSNADRSFVEGQVPSLENTPEGNRKLIDIQRKINTRKQEIAKLARGYLDRNGSFDAGFDQELATWSEANPLFPPADANSSGGGGYKIRSVR